MKINRLSRMVPVGVCGSLCLVLFGACAVSGPSRLGYGVRRFAEADRSALFQAAADALVEAGYRIDRSDRAAGMLSTFPVAGKLRDVAARRRARLGTPARIRRVVQVRIEQGADGISVYCKVAVQEQVTEAYRMQAYDLHTADSPVHTPIEREAATTREQNTVWQTVRRDKRQECEILAAVEQRIAVR